MKLAAALLVVLAAVPAAEAATQQVTVSVPPTQVLEGTTVVALTPGEPARARVIVKSNIPWTLIGRSADRPGALVRVAGQSWTPVGEATPVLRGGRGVHVVIFEVRVSGAASGQLSLSLAPAAGMAP